MCVMVRTGAAGCHFMDLVFVRTRVQTELLVLLLGKQQLIFGI